MRLLIQTYNAVAAFGSHAQYGRKNEEKSETGWYQPENRDFNTTLECSLQVGPELQDQEHKLLMMMIRRSQPELQITNGKEQMRGRNS